MKIMMDHTQKKIYINKINRVDTNKMIIIHIL